MAGDWIKMRTRLADERATMLICDLTGLDEFAVVGRLHSLWSWAGEHTADGSVTGVTLKTIDRLARHEGFAKAMIAAGWLEELPEMGGIRFPRWDAYNSKAAKERALAAKRQADKRWRDGERDGDRDATVSCHDAREEKTRGDERREEKITGRQDSVRGKPRSSLRSPIDAFDLSEVDWPTVYAFASVVAKRVPPRSDTDRRMWLKYAVLAERTFGEHWLVDAAEAVVQAKETKKNRQAHFVGVLTAKALKDHGIDEANFKALCRRIDIPTDVWKSPVLAVRGGN